MCGWVTVSRVQAPLVTLSPRTPQDTQTQSCVNPCFSSLPPGHLQRLQAEVGVQQRHPHMRLGGGPGEWRGLVVQGAALRCGCAAAARRVCAPPVQLAAAGDYDCSLGAAAAVISTKTPCSQIQTRMHTQLHTQKPFACTVPESYIRASLISAVPCPGSLMEKWFQCAAANNQVCGCVCCVCMCCF